MSNRGWKRESFWAMDVGNENSESEKGDSSSSNVVASDLKEEAAQIPPGAEQTTQGHSSQRS